MPLIMKLKIISNIHFVISICNFKVTVICTWLSHTSKHVLSHFSEQLQSYSLSHDAVSVTPRGLRNTGNMCYIHAVS